MEFQFPVQFEPVAQPRPRARAIKTSWNGKPKWTATVYDPRNHPVQMWKLHVLDAWRLAVRRHVGFRFSGPIAVQIELFTKPNKKSPPERHWDTRKRSGDVDNHAKSILDALNGQAWEDDSQVARLIVERTVAASVEKPHAWICIWDLEPPEPGPGQGNLF